jgi:hypothetical protein
MRLQTEMKKIIFGALLLLATVGAHAQVVNPTLIFVTTAPSGACTVPTPLQSVISTGALFSCQSGTWATVGGGGGGTTNTICSGTVALGTAAIASGAAATTVTATCTGLETTDAIALTFNGSPLAIVGYEPSAGGMLTILSWPTSGTINVAVVNNTASSITPGAVTLNFRVTR